MVTVGAEIDNRDTMLFTLFTDPAYPSCFLSFPLSLLFFVSLSICPVV